MVTVTTDAFVTGAVSTLIQLVEETLVLLSRPKPFADTGHDKLRLPLAATALSVGRAIAVIAIASFRYEVGKSTANEDTICCGNGRAPNETEVLPLAEGATLKVTLATSCVATAKGAPVGNVMTIPRLPAAALFVFTRMLAPDALLPTTVFTKLSFDESKTRLNSSPFSSPCAASWTGS